MDKEQRFYEQQGVAMTCRSYRECMDMFSLDERELGVGPLLDVAGGASSFAAGLRSRGIRAVSADPLYGLSKAEIAGRGEREISASTAKIAGMKDRFLWDYYGSLDEHRLGREKSLQLFMADYAVPGNRKHYVAASLPKLPFEDETFACVTCSHFLFLYEEQFDYGFHLASVKELLRVCRPGGQVRIYPLLNFRNRTYAFMERLLADLEAHGRALPEFLPTRLAFMADSTELLRLEKI